MVFSVVLEQNSYIYLQFCAPSQLIGTQSLQLFTVLRSIRVYWNRILTVTYSFALHSSLLEHNSYSYLQFCVPSERIGTEFLQFLTVLRSIPAYWNTVLTVNYSFAFHPSVLEQNSYSSLQFCAPSQLIGTQLLQLLTVLCSIQYYINNHLTILMPAYFTFSFPPLYLTTDLITKLKKVAP